MGGNLMGEHTTLATASLFSPYQSDTIEYAIMNLHTRRRTLGLQQLETRALMDGTGIGGQFDPAIGPVNPDVPAEVAPAEETNPWGFVSKPLTDAEWDKILYPEEPPLPENWRPAWNPLVDDKPPADLYEPELPAPPKPEPKPEPTPDPDETPIEKLRREWRELELPDDNPEPPAPPAPPAPKPTVLVDLPLGE